MAVLHSVDSIEPLNTSRCRRPPPHKRLGALQTASVLLEELIVSPPPKGLERGKILQSGNGTETTMNERVLVHEILLYIHRIQTQRRWQHQHLIFGQTQRQFKEHVPLQQGGHYMSAV